MKIIGISGTNGSGKDSLGNLLAEHHGFLFVSVTELLRDELRRRGVPVEREHLRNLSAEWRRESGLGVLVDKAIDAYELVKDAYPGGVAMASMRNPGEADRIHELGGIVVWMDADPKIRYERIFARQRTAEDNKTFDQFVAEEQAEMQHSGDEATLSLAGVQAKSDITIRNESNDLVAFRELAEQALGL